MAMMLWQRLAIFGGDLVVREPLTALSLVMTGLGTAVSAAGTLAAGAAAQSAAEFKAKQEEIAAQ